MPPKKSSQRGKATKAAPKKTAAAAKKKQQQQQEKKKKPVVDEHEEEDSDAPVTQQPAGGGQEGEERREQEPDPIPGDPLVFMLEFAAKYGLSHAIEGITKDLTDAETGVSELEAVLQLPSAQERDLATRLTLAAAFSIVGEMDKHANIPAALATLDEYLDDDFPHVSDVRDMAKVHHVLFFCRAGQVDLDSMEDAIDIIFTKDEEKAESRLDLVDLLKALRGKKSSVAKTIVTRLYANYPVQDLVDRVEELSDLVMQQTFDPLPEAIYNAQGQQQQQQQQQQQPQSQSQQQQQAAQAAAPAPFPTYNATNLLHVASGSAAAAAAAAMPPGVAATVNTVQQMSGPVNAKPAISPRQVLPTGVRARHRWTPQEDEAMLEGLVRFGWGKWAQVVKAYPDVFATFGRESHDLRDRWRNLEKKDGEGLSQRLIEIKEKYARKRAAKARGKEEAKAQLGLEEEQEWVAEEVARVRRHQQRVKAGLESDSDSEDELGNKKKKPKKRPSRSGQSAAAANPKAKSTRAAAAAGKKRAAAKPKANPKASKRSRR